MLYVSIHIKHVCMLLLFLTCWKSLLTNRGLNRKTIDAATVRMWFHGQLHLVGLWNATERERPSFPPPHLSLLHALCQHVRLRTAAVSQIRSPVRLPALLDECCCWHNSKDRGQTLTLLPPFQQFRNTLAMADTKLRPSITPFRWWKETTDSHVICCTTTNHITDKE